MKYLFVYYTGTYNTRFLTSKIQEQLLEAGDSCDTVEIRIDTEPIELNSYDIVGLGFPIYGFNSPLPFNRYLKKLQFRQGQKFFIYKNSGETMAMNNSASRIPLKIMKRKGCICIGEYHFLMPYNIHFPFSEDLICAMLEKDKQLLEIMKYNLTHGLVKKIKSNFWLDVGAFAVSLQKIGGNINSYFYKVDSEKCIQCGRCVNACPENNIKIKDGKVTFEHHCDMCMRCSYYCPEHAIRIGMLEKWKVTDYYDLEQLWKRESPVHPYQLTENVKYSKSYRKTFRKIDEEYRRIAAVQKQHQRNR